MIIISALAQTANSKNLLSFADGQILIVSVISIFSDYGISSSFDKLPELTLGKRQRANGIGQRAKRIKN